MISYGALLVLRLLAFPASAAEGLPAPLATGVLVEWTGSDSLGHLVFRTARDETHRCAFTGRTYFELEHRRTRISSIRTGESLEVLSEKLTDPPSCRALIVRVVRHQAPPAAGAAKLRRPFGSPTESFAPRGNLSLSAVALRFDDPYVWIRTREGKNIMLVLRDDTRLAENGLPALRQAIPMNRPLHIRAGRSAEMELEAYSIFWGDILQPDRPTPKAAKLGRK
ncbi:MAG: hypothetical protein SFV51_12045 [Bryobacteraceae bacterium]|nr:hypothetical protein [Bryobacteraceae bacterium]